MHLYELEVFPNEAQPEGEDCSEWFTSLADAKKRRKKLIEMDSELSRYGEEYTIRRYEFADLSKKKLVLAILNREAFAVSIETVVEAYQPE